MLFNHSYKPDIFSLIDIAATEEKIPCKIEEDVPKLGFLDHSSDSETLKAGSRIELPFWVAKPMAIKRQSSIKCDIPKIYKETYRDILRADSSVVVLSKWSQYYYELGIHLTALPNVQKQIIIESLLQAFKNRYRSIMDQAVNPMSDCMLAFQLPALERELFLEGKKCYKELINWIEKGTKKIETADVINTIQMKKRKRMEMEID